MTVANECEALVDSYLGWLRERFNVSEVDGVCEISTPFVDHRNDHIEVYVKRQPDGTIVLTDGGDTVQDLELSGVELASPNRRKMLNRIASVRGVTVENDELLVRSTPQDFPRKKHALIQAMLAVGDLYVTSRERVRGLFMDDVREFLSEHDIRFVPSVKIPGRSGFDHLADFVIPGAGNLPERILQAVPDPTRQTVSLVLFMWQDVQGYRAGGSQAFAMLNDEERDPSEAAAALSAYHISPLRWSQKSAAVEALTGTGHA